MTKIQLLVMDVDGTLTDGKIYMSAQGELFKAFAIRDGYGMHDLLPKAGITPVIITGRKSQIVVKRCQELGIQQVYQGCADKAEKLNEIARLFGLITDKNGVYSEIAYIGDDLNDLPCIKICGLTGCPANAIEELKETVQFVSAQNGGNGAVREFIEWILWGGLNKDGKKS